MVDRSTGKLLISQLDLDVFCFLTQYLIPKPAFTTETIYEDFLATLKGNNLLKKEEVKDFSNCKNFIQLFAISIMHGYVIMLQTGEKANVYVEFDDESRSGFLTAMLVVPVTHPNSKTFFATPVISTTLKSQEYCDEELLTLGQTRDVFIEVKPTERLGII